MSRGQKNMIYKKGKKKSKTVKGKENMNVILCCIVYIICLFILAFILLPGIIVLPIYGTKVLPQSVLQFFGTENDSISALDFNLPQYVQVSRSGGGHDLLIPLEDYVFGVVASEVPSSFESEAIKAQAVAARTYAVAKIQSGVQHQSGGAGLQSVQRQSGRAGLQSVQPQRGGAGLQSVQHQSGGAPLCDTTHCQVYHSPKELAQLKGQYWKQYMDLESPVYGTLENYENGIKEQIEIIDSLQDSFDNEKKAEERNDAVKIARAVSETEGQVLTYDGELVTHALFHSSSGGQTENSEDVFVSTVPYLRSVVSPYEDEATHRQEQRTFTYEELSSKLKSNFPKNPPGKIDSSNIKIIERSEGGGIIKLKIGDGIYTGRQIREALSLHSSYLDIETDGKTATFTTMGYGHRVGMSQYGANGMAKAGYTYMEILEHYYTGIELSSS